MAQFAPQSQPENEAQAINAKAKMFQEYNNSAQGTAAQPVRVAPKPAQPIAPGGRPWIGDRGGNGGKRPAVKKIDTSGMMRPLGSFKKGGKVKKTGVYKLHQGERVLNAKQTKASGPLMAALAGNAKA